VALMDIGEDGCGLPLDNTDPVFGKIMVFELLWWSGVWSQEERNSEGGPASTKPGYLTCTACLAGPTASGGFCCSSLSILASFF
jgi:hypothetical protein